MKNRPYNNMLRNNEQFLQKLADEAQTEAYLNERQRQAEIITRHPSYEQLYDYVLGWLPGDISRIIRTHLAQCRRCTDEVLLLMRNEEEFDHEAEAWADTADVQRERAHAAPPLHERIVVWISDLWEPRWAGELVTAADIPEQRYTFLTEDGEVTLSCHWHGAYRDEPGSLQLSWKADFSRDGTLWVRFVEPESQRLRKNICLGSRLAGTETIMADELGFDPSSEPWAIAIMLQAGTD